MASPSLSGTITLSDASRGIRTFNEHMKVNAQNVVQQIADGKIQAQVIANYRDLLRNHKATAAPFIAMMGPRLVAYMQAELPNDKADIEADQASTFAAVDAVDAFISAVLEKNSSGKLGVTFPVTSLPALQTQVEALLATIS